MCQNTGFINTGNVSHALCQQVTRLRSFKCIDAECVISSIKLNSCNKLPSTIERSYIFSSTTNFKMVQLVTTIAALTPYGASCILSMLTVTSIHCGKLGIGFLRLCVCLALKCFCKDDCFSFPYLFTSSRLLNCAVWFWICVFTSSVCCVYCIACSNFNVLLCCRFFLFFSPITI